MRARLLLLLLLALPSSLHSGGIRANFLRIWVTANNADSVRAIWRPLAGAVDSTGEKQQAAIVHAWAPPNDTLARRRGMDAAARDTVVATAPVQFVVDMNNGAITIEAPGLDSIRVAVQLMVARGPIVSSTGRRFVIESDGSVARINGRP